MKGKFRRLQLFCLTLCCALCYLPNAQAQVYAGDPRATQYLAEHEPELKETTAPVQRTGLLLKLAAAALEAGEAGKAEGYAREALTLGEAQDATTGIHSDAVHVSNIVLGRLALMKGDVGKAKEHLLSAGRMPGSPMLKTFGPNMLLAKELIMKGERDAAVAYLDLCAKFWEMRGDKLEKWKNVISQDGVPDFGSNLNVGLGLWRNKARN